MAIPFVHAIKATFHDRAAYRAVVHPGQHFTYRDLDQRASAGAARLQEVGVGKGDRVVLCTSDKLAFLLGHLATLYAGGVTVPLNPRFTRDELRFFLQDSAARVVLVGQDAQATIESLKPELPGLHAVINDAAILQATVGTGALPDLTGDDPCLIIYSSGTTGWPKGIVHTQANVVASLRALQACWRFTPDDVVLNVLPLFHIHGLGFATQLTLLTGATLILDDFQPQQTLERMQECTVFMAVPTIYYRFLEQPSFRAMARAWEKPRLFTCGSAPIRAEVLPELEAILGRPVINRYGMSEAYVITSLPLDGPRPWGSVGLPLPGVDVRILADEDEQRAASGEVGAVQVRGPNLFREYWKNPDATKAAFANGWFDTGDLGFRDEAGYLTLVGRKNDLIITNGYNVYPQVVERVINECPGVRESAVVGIPDERKGERVAAFVVRFDPTLSEDRLRAFWTERLVDYQRPKDLLFVDALPRNALGKVLRRELRDQVSEKKA